jgi:formylglycine-generating enzyme required for sulfatase activity
MPVLAPANSFGLYGMHNGLWEWCRDTYHPEFYRSCAGSSVDPVNASECNTKALRGGPCAQRMAGTAPANTSESSTKMLRGGASMSAAADCRSAQRMAGTSFIGYEYSGFRPVWSLYPMKD